MSARGDDPRATNPRTTPAPTAPDGLDAAQQADIGIRPSQRAEREQHEEHEEHALGDARDEDDRERAAQSRDAQRLEQTDRALGRGCGAVGVGGRTAGVLRRRVDCGERGDEHGRDDVRDGIGRNDEAEIADREQDAAERTADEPAEVLIQADQCIGRDQALGVDQVGQQRVLRRLEERAERGVHEDDGVRQRKVGDVVHPEEGEEGEGLADVHRDHDPAAVEPTDEPSGERREHHRGHELQQERDGCAERRTGELEHDERKCDEQQPVARVGDEPGRPKPAERGNREGSTRGHFAASPNVGRGNASSDRLAIAASSGASARVAAM